MVPSDNGSITVLFQQLRNGNLEAAQKLWERFFPRLVGLARKVLAGRELPVGAEDAVQVAFFDFFRRVESGYVDGDSDRDMLWKLLSVMTARAAKKQLRWEATQKRGGGKTFSLSAMEEGEFDLEQTLGAIEGPECDLICEDLLNQLAFDLREVAVLRLAGYSNQEIKLITRCPLRSVERRVHLIRETWRDYLGE